LTTKLKGPIIGAGVQKSPGMGLSSVEMQNPGYQGGEMIARIVHVNVVCTDIERSLRFYRDILGAKVVSSLGGGESAELAEAMGFEGAAQYRAYLLSFGEGSKTSPTTLIDLLQWAKPPGKGKPYDTMNNVGIARICFAVDHIDKTYEDLKAKGVEFITPPRDMALRPGAVHPLLHRACFFRDPDGVMLELAAPVK
jgi:catechol 2,3-dioxygenase-like lactoylglutathione lyase family enzyme